MSTDASNHMISIGYCINRPVAAALLRFHRKRPSLKYDVPSSKKQYPVKDWRAAVRQSLFLTM